MLGIASSMNPLGKKRTFPPHMSIPPQGTTVPPHPGGNRHQVTVPPLGGGGGGPYTTPDQPILV